MWHGTPGSIATRSPECKSTYITFAQVYIRSPVHADPYITHRSIKFTKALLTWSTAAFLHCKWAYWTQINHKCYTGGIQKVQYVRGAIKKFCNFDIKNNHKLSVMLSFSHIVSCDINVIFPLFCYAVYTLKKDFLSCPSNHASTIAFSDSLSVNRS